MKNTVKIFNSSFLSSNFKNSCFFTEIVIPKCPKTGKFGEEIQSNPKESQVWLLFPLKTLSLKQINTSGNEKCPIFKKKLIF